MRLPAATALPLDRPEGASRARLEEAARGLEAQFANLLLKSMRSASMGDPLLGNTTYREMHDQQLAKELTKGRGLGLAPMIMRQLEGSAGAAQALPAGAPLPLQRAPMALPMADTPSGLPLPAGLRGGALAMAPTDRGVSLSTPLALPAAPPARMHAPGAGAALDGAGNPLAATPGVEGCDPDAPLDCSSPEAFVRSIWPHAVKTADALGVPPKALVAQAALETGWGRRLVGQERNTSSHNLFGIKAGGRWSGARVDAATHEYRDGVRRDERAAFRAYGSTAESFADYQRLLGNPRYAQARGAGDDVQRFASALQRAGYATDPAYAAKITAIAEGATLRRALAALPSQDRG